LPVGYSDHTEGITIPIAAASMGASVIEKHFTLDRSLPGPDHPASLEPYELQAMVQAIRDVESAFGNGVKQPYQNEEAIKLVVRKSVVANLDIKAGDMVQKADITIKRPGTGIEPKYLDFITGKRAKAGISKDQVITWDMIG
jgi:N-acetylneuraminate synthase/N,N'-diacetyllegionaminate synthase